METKNKKFFCNFGACQFKAASFDEIVEHRLKVHRMMRVRNPLVDGSAIGGTPDKMYLPEPLWAYVSVGEEE
ncbi:MAG: hypothetical protein GWP21_06335 [Euryarchaeota archaeon]|nr:hypothetical protein [Euryarchaeota archaeon]